VALVVVLTALAILELRGGEQGGGQAAQAPDGSGPPAAPQVTVTLQATAAVWTRATVDGRVAYQGTLTAGARRTFSGRRVVELHLGNSRGAPGRPGQVWRGRFAAAPDGP
jgi:hypothetical protein